MRHNFENHIPELWSKGEKATPSFFSVSYYLNLCNDIYDYFNKLGIKIHPSSRVAEYRRVITKHLRNKYTKDYGDSIEIELLTVALSELPQLAIIARHCFSNINNPEYKEKAYYLLKDTSLDRRQKQTETPGRDTQFELFLAASWQKSGVNCRIGEPPKPDLIIEIDDQEFGVESKRLKSIQSLNKRAKKANTQLQRMKRGGVFATELSLCVNGCFPCFTAKTPSMALADLEYRLRELMFSYLNQVKKKVKPKKVFAWMGFCQSLYLCDDIGPAILYQWKSVNLGKPNNLRFSSFTNVFSVLANVMDARSLTQKKLFCTENKIQQSHS